MGVRQTNPLPFSDLHQCVELGCVAAEVSGVQQQQATRLLAFCPKASIMMLFARLVGRCPRSSVAESAVLQCTCVGCLISQLASFRACPQHCCHFTRLAHGLPVCVLFALAASAARHARACVCNEARRWVAAWLPALIRRRPLSQCSCWPWHCVRRACLASMPVLAQGVACVRALE